jgi:hypothetical protein
VSSSIDERIDAAFRRADERIDAACRRILLAVSAANVPRRDWFELQTAARRVVWAWQSNDGIDRWALLGEAIAALEEIVGRPEREDLI